MEYDIVKINLHIIDLINKELKKVGFEVYSTLNGANYHVLKIYYKGPNEENKYDNCTLVSGCEAKDQYEFNNQLRAFLHGLQLMSYMY